MQWTLTPRRERANHNPVLVLNGMPGRGPAETTAHAGDVVRLDATGSTDPNGNALTYRWRHYAELSGGFRPVDVTIERSDTPKAGFKVPGITNPSFQIILEVTDNGEPALTSYRRIIVHAAR